MTTAGELFTISRPDDDDDDDDDEVDGLKMPITYYEDNDG